MGLDMCPTLIVSPPSWLFFGPLFKKNQFIELITFFSDFRFFLLSYFKKQKFGGVGIDMRV